MLWLGFDLNDYPKTLSKCSMLVPQDLTRSFESWDPMYMYLIPHTMWVLVIFSMWRISLFIGVLFNLLVFLLGFLQVLRSLSSHLCHSDRLTSRRCWMVSLCPLLIVGSDTSFCNGLDGPSQMLLGLLKTSSIICIRLF